MSLMFSLKLVESICNYCLFIFVNFETSWMKAWIFQKWSFKLPVQILQALQQTKTAASGQPIPFLRDCRVKNAGILWLWKIQVVWPLVAHRFHMMHSSQLTIPSGKFWVKNRETLFTFKLKQCRTPFSFHRQFGLGRYWKIEFLSNL